jgi:AraC-like DNA-binding protein
MELLSIFRLFYLLGGGYALFFCILIFSKKNKTKADIILGIWLVVLAVQLIIPFLYLANFNIYYKYAGIEIVFFVFHPVFLYLYIKLMIGKIPTLKNIIYTVIPIIISEIAALSFFIYPAARRLDFFKGKILLPSVFYPFLIFMIFYFYFYAALSYKELKVYKNTVLQVYSYRENVDLLWLRRLVLLFSFIIMVVFPVGIVSYFYFHSIVFADYFFYLALVVFIFFLGFWGYQQGEVFSLNGGTMIPNGKANNKTPALSMETKVLFKEKAIELKQVMISSKPYLNPKLTIHDLAQSVQMPPHQLSKIIYFEFRCNFFEFVNSYRIQEFKDKAFSKEFRNLTILAIALECGFNSKSSFNRIFKDSTGITPGDFLKYHHP